MSEKSTSKYASEAFELFRLFNRVGKSFFGLLLLEIGWLFTLWLATKLVPDDAKLLTLPIPVVKTIQPFNIDFKEINITIIAVIGGIIISIWWLFHSRLYHYIYRPIELLVKFIVIWLIIIVSFVISLTESIIQFIFWPLTKKLILYRRNKIKKSWITSYERENPGINPKEAYLEFAEKQKKEKNIDLLEKPTLTKSINDGTIVGKNSAKVAGMLLLKIQSYCSIGIADLTSYTYDEDFHSNKLRLQSFTVAIAKINHVLESIPEFKLVKFYDLPSHFKITNNTSARNQSRFLGLDALLWGSYLDAENKVVWLNIYTTIKTKEQKISDDYGLEFLDSFFPNEVKIDDSAITFSQDDYQEAFIAMLISVIQTLQARVVKRTKQFRLYRIDNVYYKANRIVDKILFHLVSDSLQILPNLTISKGVLPSIQVQLVEIISKWVGQKLNDNYLKYSIDSKAKTSISNVKSRHEVILN